MVDYIDGENRLIYLDASTANASIHPIDIFKEVRTMRKVDENLQKYLSFIRADGNVLKAGVKSTERYVTLLDGTRIVPYDTSHTLTLTGTIITDDGNEGKDCFNKTLLTIGSNVDINYFPPQVEIITVITGSAVTAQDKLDIALEVWSSTIRTLTSAGSGGATAQEVWEYAQRNLTTTVFNSNIIEVTGTPVVSVDDFKADAGGVSSGDVNIIAVAGEPVASIDEFKADTVNVDLSTIPQAVWEYVTRELTVAAGLTPEQEAKLDQMLIDIDNVPTSTENATEVWNHVLPNI